MRSFCKVIETGMYTSVQDGGRIGWRHRGVPVSGPMDRESFTQANAVLGNPEDAACLEITQMGPTLLFNDPTWVSVSGAQISIEKNKVKHQMDSGLFCDVGDVLSLGQTEKGVRSYLAFQGGLQTEIYLGSRAQFYPISPSATLEKGEKLYFHPTSATTVPPSKVSKGPIASLHQEDKLLVNKGLDWDACPAAIREALFSTTMLLGSNNRMGYRIEAALPKSDNQPLSGIVVPGTVQLTPGGNLLVAMQDGQVTGGYLRILQLDPAAINFLAQQASGKKLQLQWAG